MSKEQDAAHSFDETFYSQITEVRGWLLHNKIEVDEQSYVRLADALHAVSKFKPMESELTSLRSELQQKDEVINELVEAVEKLLRVDSFRGDFPYTTKVFESVIQKSKAK